MVKHNKFEQATKSSDWFQWCESLLELYETEKYFAIKGKNITVSHNNIIQLVIGTPMTGKNKMLTMLLLDSMASANKKVPGSGNYVPWFLYNQGKDNTTAIRASSSFYADAALKLSRSENAKSIFKSVFENVGPLTKIVTKSTYESFPFLKYRNAFNFKLKLDSKFHQMIGHVDYIEEHNPIVIMIEGAPETVSELDPLLQWNHESRRPIVLVARNYTEEVAATLATNYVKNTLNVFPFIYGDSLETLNLAADMCSITKGELISPHFGDSIVTAIIDRDKWGSVDRFGYSNSKLSLYKTVDVSGQRDRIIQKLKEEEIDDVQDLLKERLLSLSNDSMEVNIPDEDTSTATDFNAILECYNAYVISGYIESPLGPLPKSFVDTAIEHAESLKKEILNVGGFLLREKYEVVAG